MTSARSTWSEEQRMSSFQMSQDPVVAPLGLDFHEAYRQHLVDHPVLRHQGRVTLFRMQDILYVNRHPDVLGNGAAGHLMGGEGNLLIPLDIDGAEHTKFRRLLDPLFAPKSKVSRIARLEPVIRALTNELIDEFIDAGGVEAYEAFCAPLPTRIFIDMLGLPRADLEFFQAFKDGVLRPEGQTMEEMRDNSRAAAQRMMDYLNALLDERQRRGEVGDDLLGGFMDVEVDGDKLARDQILNITLLLVIAGLDTVVASLSCFLTFLGRNPEYRRQIVADPSLIGGAVEELLRCQSPVQQGSRRASKDLTLPSGDVIEAGELIQTVWAAANLDDVEFTDATTVDFTRSPNRHIAFASGFHRCLGSHLARMELRLAMEEWHKRIPDYRVRSDDELQMINHGVRTVFHLPLVFPA